LKLAANTHLKIEENQEVPSSNVYYVSLKEEDGHIDYKVDKFAEGKFLITEMKTGNQTT
jgi:hypothetical protein